MSVMALFRGAYRAVFGQGLLALKAMVIPLCAVIVISFGSLLLGDFGAIGDVTSTLLAWLPFVLLGICWSRWLLLGEAPTKLTAALGARRFLLSLIYSVLILLAVVAVVVLVTIIVARNSDSIYFVAFMALVAFFAACWPASRLCLVFPAAAIDEGLSLAESWRMTEGQGSRLFFAAFLTVFPLLVVSALAALVMVWLFANYGELSDATLAQGTQPALMQARNVILLLIFSAVANIIQFITFLLLVSVFSAAYPRLIRWRQGPRQDLLERFE